ncbi:MAG: DUF2232 domain-containing protein [Spirochaetes bacterium]|jgi:hypothetical protein|nr:DUF2232 domain-containing protein [Spirochaetota bacterium]
MSTGVIIVFGSLLIAGISLPVYKWGYKVLSGIFIVTLAAIFTIGDSFVSLSTVLTLLTIATVAGLTFRYRLSVQFYILTTSFSLAAMLCIHYYYMLYFTGSDVFLELLGQLKKQVSQLPEQTEAMEANVEAIAFYINTIKEYHIEPYYLFLNSLFMTVITYFFLRLIYTFYVIKKVIIMKGIEFFKLDERIVLLLIAFLAGFIFIKPEMSQILFTICINGLFMLITLYFIQSMGIIRHFLMRKKLPLFILPLGIAMTLIFNASYFPVIAVMLAGLGLLDVWTDFRGFNRTTDSEKK